MIQEAADINMVRQILRAQDYWQEKGIAVDVVIINERRTSYLQELQKDVDDLVAKERVSRRVRPASRRARSLRFVRTCCSRTLSRQSRHRHTW